MAKSLEPVRAARIFAPPRAVAPPRIAVPSRFAVSPRVVVAPLVVAPSCVAAQGALVSPRHGRSSPMNALSSLRSDRARAC
jgi:hypothetical protein